MGEPMPSPLSKAHGQYRFQLLLRSVKVRSLARIIAQVIGKTTLPSDVIVTWDVDAMQLM
jgi:primosomal protein N' (replication factor Y)